MPDMELIDKRVDFSLNDSGFTLPGDAVYTIDWLMKCCKIVQVPAVRSTSSQLK